ncbi:TonB-dependent receptor [Niabella ginsengisoli]|uniref:TonB-dependent receptor n=1 Tax=Niabella ginsengisoli TaxID=522298 RepID=A0ABS9SPJ9_9BACT|nr:TonB-dependent receptor [Niabella ginsengisoli]MCH5600191.1 TonB-dependent receptor [Niabella ginsengisoli]
MNVTVLLAPSFNDSNVTVTAHVPIRMNGDTLEINPAAFKMDPNAVVEDLLTQVPGVTVWADGSITMNGRKIPSVLVDGKPFMGSGDARLATQNLPKNAIDKIQVYQEVDRSLKPEERKQKDSLLTMNIKLKEDKKTGYFGKAGIGYGTDRFESDLSFQMYNKKTSFGFGGGFNNINKSVKNLQEMFQNNTYRNYNPNLYNVGSFDKDGINKYHSIGGVFTHNFIETTNSRQNDRITVNYTKSGSEQFLTDLSLQNRTTEDNPQFIENNSVSNNTNNSNDIGVNYIKTNSYNDQFTVNGTATFSNNSGNTKSTTDIEDPSGNPISNNDVNNREDSRSNDQSLSVDYRSYSQEDPLKQFSVNLNVNNNNSSSNRYVNSVFKSYINSDDDTAYNRNYNNNNANLNLSANASYEGLKRLLLGRYNLFGISLSFDQWFNYNKSNNKQNVFDFDTLSGNYIINSKLTNTNLNEKIEYTPSLRLGKSIFKWKDSYYYNFYSNVNIVEDIKQDRNTSSIDIRNLSRSFAFFRYEGNLGYYYQKREKLSYNVSANYRKNYGYPDIDQLYTITDGLDVFNVRIGNPNLKNQVNHTYSIYGNFNTQKPKSKYALNGNLNGSFLKSLNPVTDSLINDSSGKRFYYYINAPESRSFNMSYNLNLTRNLKKVIFSLCTMALTIME